MLGAINSDSLKLQKSQGTVLFVAIFIVYVIFSFVLAFFTNFALNKFGADWTNFWGWVALYGIAPIIRIWISGRAN